MNDVAPVLMAIVLIWIAVVLVWVFGGTIDKEAITHHQPIVINHTVYRCKQEKSK